MREYQLSLAWSEASRIVLSATGQVLSTDAVSEHLRPAADNALLAVAPRTDGRLGVWLTHLQAHQQYLVRVEASNSLGGSPLPDDATACKFLSASARTHSLTLSSLWSNCRRLQLHMPSRSTSMFACTRTSTINNMTFAFSAE